MHSMKRASGVSGLFRHGPQCRVPEPIRRATRKDWLYLFGQFGLVAGVELSDDFAHALHPLANAPSGVAHAGEVWHFEMAHGFWIEPAVVSFFKHTHYILGQAIGWDQVSDVANTLYGQGHVLFTVLFAMWIFFYRRGLFTFLRNVFLLTNLLAVALYEAFPLAPPRLTPGLLYDGHSFSYPPSMLAHGIDGVKIGFNEFAAMPSVHVAWATIVGLTLAWAARPLIIRVLGLIYPVAMLTTVVVTGNHYLTDAVGAEIVVCIAVLFSILIAWRASGHRSLVRALDHLQRLRHGIPRSATEPGVEAAADTPKAPKAPTVAA